MYSNTNKPRDCWKRKKLLRSICPSRAIGVSEIYRRGGSILASRLVRTQNYLIILTLVTLLVQFGVLGCSKDEVPMATKDAAKTTDKKSVGMI